MSNLNYQIMKKSKFLVLIAAIASLGFLVSSCGEDGAAPVVTMSANSIQDTEVLTVGDTALIEFSVDAEEGVKAVVITDSKANDVVKFTDFSKATYSYEYVPEAVGSEILNITVTDKKDQITKVSLAITIEAAAPAIKSYTGKVLGAQSAAEGSYFDIVSGTVIGQASANAAGTSVSYSYAAIGTPNAVATLIAPAVRLANGLTKTSVGAEKCYFKKATIAFATATKEDINALTVSATSEQKITVAKGDVVEFLTASGKKGLISVTDLTNGVDGKITIDVKVQE